MSDWDKEIYINDMVELAISKPRFKQNRTLLSASIGRSASEEPAKRMPYPRMSRNVASYRGDLLHRNIDKKPSRHNERYELPGLR